MLATVTVTIYNNKIMCKKEKVIQFYKENFIKIWKNYIKNIKLQINL